MDKVRPLRPRLGHGTNSVEFDSSLISQFCFNVSQNLSIWYFLISAGEHLALSQTVSLQSRFSRNILFPLRFSRDYLLPWRPFVEDDCILYNIVLFV